MQTKNWHASHSLDAQAHLEERATASIVPNIDTKKLPPQPGTTERKKVAADSTDVGGQYATLQPGHQCL